MNEMTITTVKVMMKAMMIISNDGNNILPERDWNTVGLFKAVSE